jgi:hypothetical protein
MPYLLGPPTWNKITWLNKITYLAGTSTLPPTWNDVLAQNHRLQGMAMKPPRAILKFPARGRDAVAPILVPAPFQKSFMLCLRNPFLLAFLTCTRLTQQLSRLLLCLGLQDA